MKKTYLEIATSIQLWNEYFNTDAAMSDEEFEQMSVESKIQLLVDSFGPEA